MSDLSTPEVVDYASLGLIANPFPAPEDFMGEFVWVRPVAYAASNRLLGAVIRSHEAGLPVLATMREEVADFYYRLVENHFLARTMKEPERGLMALNIPLDSMRLGRIRGTLAELAELAVAVDFPLTLSMWFATQLAEPAADLPEAALVATEDLAEARELMATDPQAAIERYLGINSKHLSDSEMDVVVHEAYLRQVAQPVEVEKDEETLEIPPVDLSQTAVMPDDGPIRVELEGEAARDADAAVREYLLALVRARLSPVIARGVSAFGENGEGLAAQEIKITKAPRKTLAALLELLNARWPNIAVIYDSFGAWPILDRQTRTDVLTSMTELRYLIAPAGAMVVCVIQGQSPELEEQYAAAVHIDWTMTEIDTLYGAHDHAVDRDMVQRWLDSAGIDGTSPVRADSPEFERLIEAAGNDVIALVAIAEAAFHDAAVRGACTLDDEAVAAGLAVPNAGGAA